MVHFCENIANLIHPLFGGIMEVPIHPAAADQTDAAQIKAFNDKGQFRKARELAEDIEREIGADPEGTELSADFWFQFALANQMTGRSGDTQYIRAALASGFSPTMAVDIKRDNILYMIRMGRAEQAQYLVSGLQVESSDIDNNRWLASVMTKGRIFYALKDFNQAFDRFEEAAVGWMNLDESADKQWERNNLFWLYKAAMVSGKRSEELKARRMSQPMLESRVSDDPSFSRRITVWFGDHFGRLGIRTLDALESLWFRLPRILH